MAISPLAGKRATSDMLVDLAKLEGEYYARRPDMGDPNQSVAFGTSGHRGSSFRGSFNEAHILAITQAICDYRRRRTPSYLTVTSSSRTQPRHRARPRSRRLG